MFYPALTGHIPNDTLFGVACLLFIVCALVWLFVRLR